MSDNGRTASSGRQFLAIGPYCWGKADTIKEAIRRAMINSPSQLHDRSRRKDYRGKNIFGIWNVPENASVNDFGGVAFDQAEGIAVQIGYVDIDGKLTAGPDDMAQRGAPK